MALCWLYLRKKGLVLSALLSTAFYGVMAYFLGPPYSIPSYQNDMSQYVKAELVSKSNSKIDSSRKVFWGNQ
jgi:hypothetical protein